MAHMSILLVERLSQGDDCVLSDRRDWRHYQYCYGLQRARTLYMQCSAQICMGFVFSFPIFSWQFITILHSGELYMVEINVQCRLYIFVQSALLVKFRGRPSCLRYFGVYSLVYYFNQFYCHVAFIFTVIIFKFLYKSQELIQNS